MTARLSRRHLVVAVFIISCLGLSWPLSAAFGADHQHSFLKGLEDVPLMPGFREIESSLVIFDQPQGRIIEAEAEGNSSWRQVRAFYRSALPALGWRPAPGHGQGRPVEINFQRPHEELGISLIDANQQTRSARLHFSLTPK